MIKKSQIKSSHLYILFAIAAISAILFIPGLGAVHLFDWDELNFAESAREMIVSGDYLRVQIDYIAFWEKPPFFIWLQVLSMKLFGINEFAARFPNAVCGIVTLMVLYGIGSRLKNQRFGLIWMFAYMASLLPFFYFKSGIIDPWFNLFIFLGIYFFIRFTAPHNITNGLKQVALSAFFIGLAILTKGPVGLLIFLLTFVVYLLFKRFKLRCNWKQVVLFSIITTFVGGFWYLLLWLHGGKELITEFINYQIRLFTTPDAGHGGFLLYHFVILFFGVFPASILALPVFRRKVLQTESSEEIKHFFHWQMITFWVVLVLFTIVTTKIVHYSSMCYFPLTFLAAWQIDRIFEHKATVPRYVKILLLSVAILLTVLVGMLPFIDRLKPLFIPLIDDEFACGNLEAVSNWTGFEPLLGIILLCGIVYFFRLVKREKIQKAFIALVCASVFFIGGVIYTYPLQVEKYTQNAVVEFYCEKATEDCYIHPLFYTYAHYFYAEKTPKDRYESETFLRYGNIDKPAYFVMRKDTNRIAQFLSETPELQLLYEKNGFVFFVRKF